MTALARRPEHTAPRTASPTAPHAGHTGHPAPADAPLDLHRLRTLRTALREEEERISYWRRLLHARIDLVRAGAGTDGHLTLEQVERALGDTGRGHGREVFLRVRAFDPLPGLPVLRTLWSSEDVAELEVAAEELSVYRTALHERIDALTDALVEHYREDPSRALTVLG
ncbi:RsiG family protein [Nocardioides bruguierae]|uniref:RsiG family protein n=1 Tax=Nocardioides bruguierae TaxID=2945102 RepID=UPI002021CB05|nr:hypothetical protein [Nocardioides bruguierae]MCL8027631.1 hypothetical protein [Nocardioides bruguierae]